MAYYDHGAAMRKQEELDKYIELKKHITSKDNNGKINEWVLAHFHMVDMENELKEKESKIKEYENFFSMMSNLMPRQYSIHDVIG